MIHPAGAKKFTDIVYGVISEDKAATQAEMQKSRRQFDPSMPEFKLFVGDLHGHTNLSDGRVDIDFYFQNIRDRAKLDFAALTDHDHGGVAAPTLYHGGTDSKWELIKSKVKEYNEEGKFTTILAYERDSYPFFNNNCKYSLFSLILNSLRLCFLSNPNFSALTIRALAFILLQLFC